MYKIERPHEQDMAVTVTSPQEVEFVVSSSHECI